MVRAFDFPRYQLLVLSVLSFGALMIHWYDNHNRWHLALIVLLMASMAYQAYRIYPYTPLAHVMMESVEGQPPELTLKVMVANVYMDNTREEALIAQVEHHQPDMLLALEVNAAWIERLSKIHDAYPYRVLIPQDNTYGMALYSKKALSDTEVRHLVEDDVPSIRTQVQLDAKTTVTFYGIHPNPPSPQESTSSLPRDVELIAVAQEVQARPNAPVIVAGDLNDVAWSNTTRLFLKLSQLLDPRRGRGMFNTFHAKIWPLLVPLDHVFVSRDFRLMQIERLPYVHSDHYPILVHIAYQPYQPDTHGEMPMDMDALQTANEKVQDAKDEPDLSVRDLAD